MLLFLLPILAVFFGFVIVRLSHNFAAKHIKLLLAFSGAFLLSLTIFELLPEVYKNTNLRDTGLFIMFGILLQIILEFFSKGAEHGHVHVNKNSTIFPWVLFTSLCIHSFLEGFPIHEHNDMVYGILVHKIPIAILITSYLYQSGLKSFKIFIFLTLFAAMTPLGTLISNYSEISSLSLNSINAVVIGIFLHISTTILFESSEGHKFNLNKILVIIFAIAIAYYM